MEDIFNNFYHNKKILITGNTGFKGSWLSFWLYHLGAKVFGYALNPISKPNLFETININDKTRTKIADIRDFNSLSKFFNEVSPEIVFHLAAQPLVKQSYKDSRSTYETNVMGTVNLFECIKESSSVKQVIIVTSDKCYENKETNISYKETDQMGGYDPYSSSKGCVELITNSYRNSFFNLADFGKKHNVSIASVRAGNVIGGGDWSEDRLIPDFVRAVTSNNESPINSKASFGVNTNKIVLRNPNSIRPWQHVFDALFGYLMLCKNLAIDNNLFSGGWNFGPKNEDNKTVEEVISQIIKLWNKGSYTIESSDLHEASLLYLDITKAISILNWTPLYNTKDTINKTVEWYKSYYDEQKGIEALSLSQIEKYILQAQKIKA